MWIFCGHNRVARGWVFPAIRFGSANSRPLRYYADFASFPSRENGANMQRGLTLALSSLFFLLMFVDLGAFTALVFPLYESSTFHSLDMLWVGARRISFKRIGIRGNF